MKSEELFTRLLYFGLSTLHLSPEEFWLTPFGEILDLHACHLQAMGIEKPRTETNIDEIIPFGI